MRGGDGDRRPHSNAPVRYEAKLVSSVLAALLAVAATNYAVDPYGIFHASHNADPLNRELFESNVRLAKAHIVAGFRPEAVIMGSSRAEVGLSPAHPGWEYERVYNLGIPKANVREMVEYLEHAIAAGSLEQVVLGVDFFQFNPLLEAQPDFTDCRLLEPGSLWSRFRAAACDIPALFFSRRAFFASITQWQNKGNPVVYLSDGSRSDSAKESALRSAGSQHAGFLMNELDYFEQVGLLRGFIVSETSFEEATGPHFEEFLRLCHRHDVDLRLYLSPSHARHWEVADEMGLWEMFLRWKRYLLVTTRSIAKEFDAEPFPIWDFADYNAYTLEPVPPLYDAEARMQWHWESSHFTKALGTRLLDEILGVNQTDLGAKLSLDDLDELIRSIESRRAEYRRTAETELQLLHDYLSSPEKREEIQERLARQN